MISTLDRSTVKALRSELEEALQSIATKHGVAITVGNATFTASNVTFKLEVATKSADGTVQTKEAEQFKRLAPRFGLNPDWLNQTFQLDGREYRVVGLNPKARRYPVIARDMKSEKDYKLSTSAIKAAMVAKAVSAL